MERVNNETSKLTLQNTLDNNNESQSLAPRLETEGYIGHIAVGETEPATSATVVEESSTLKSKHIEARVWTSEDFRYFPSAEDIFDHLQDEDADWLYDEGKKWLEEMGYGTQDDEDIDDYGNDW